MSRRALWIFVILFVITRIPIAWLASQPETYTHDGIVAASDVALYNGWATALIDEQQRAYSAVPIEYPPGSLPFILIPHVVPGNASYLNAFVAMMLVIDIAAFFGLYVISSRWGSRWGMVLWILALPALGPIIYLRLDLVPAVATIWAFERASARDWLGGGGWMGVGAIAKLYPLLFLPAGVILATHKRRFALAASVVFVAPLLPLIPSFQEMVSSVLGYHSDRGIQVESLWGGILFLAQKTGSDVSLGYSFGALHFDGPLAETLKTVAAVASIVGLVVGTWIATRARDRDRGKAYAEVCFVILVLSLATGTVFSPQFLIWLVAIGGVVAGMTDSRLRPFTLVLIPTALVTHAIFPFMYNDLLFGEDLPVALLWIRNAIVVILAVAAAATLWVGYRKEVNVPSTPELASR
jgi:hypothetical protein